MSRHEIAAALAAPAITPQETDMSETATVTDAPTDTTEQWQKFLEALTPVLQETQPVAFGVVLGLRESHDGGVRVRTHAVARLPEITEQDSLRELAVLFSRNFSSAVATEVGRIAANAAAAAIAAADDAPKADAQEA